MTEPGDLLVEIHVPLTRALDLAEDEDPYPWIDQIMEELAELDEGELYDDGEEWEEHFVFLIHGASEETLLAQARRIAALPGVPSGVFAVVTSTEAGSFGTGTKVEIS